MENLGQLLKSEREKRGLTLHEIGLSLKINPKILKAIEDGDQTHLPAKTFLRGFIRSYAQYLRIDIALALELFQNEYGSTKPEEPNSGESARTSSASGSSPTSPTVPKNDGPRLVKEDHLIAKQNNSRVYQIIGTLVILVMIAFVAKMIDKYQKESHIERDHLEQELSDVSRLNLTTTSSLSTSTTLQDEAPMSMATPVSSSSTVTSTSLHSSTSLHPSTTIHTSTSTTHAKISTTTLTTTTLKTTTTSKTSTSTRITTTSLAAVATSVTTTTQNKNVRSIEVILEALNKISVRFSLSDGKWETLNLATDEIHVFKSKSKINLEISDGGAVNVIVNGRDRGVPGTIGKPIKLSYP
ncbi:MAG: hypothetical protein COT73_07705 [Bdellovibrio sp. CG10_big_fil_rev_8_21_14_0_10_47_8]|nr:MAG: hypothetical protein COT73_07705 [Bdellovibrio sp. CG10_big_fil_rev_8_21_14_0_10_47_8]